MALILVRPVKYTHVDAKYNEEVAQSKTHAVVRHANIFTKSNTRKPSSAPRGQNALCYVYFIQGFPKGCTGMKRIDSHHEAVYISVNLTAPSVSLRCDICSCMKGEL